MNAFEKFLACIYVLRYSDKNKKSIMRNKKNNGDILYSVNDADIIMSVGEYIPTYPKKEKDYRFDATIHQPGHKLENKRVLLGGLVARQLYAKIAHAYKYSAYQK